MVTRCLVNSDVRRFDSNRMRSCFGIVLVVTVGIFSANGCKQQTARGPKTPARVANDVTQTKNDLRSDSLTPQNGYVPDEQTAIAIAVAAWIPIYGKAHIESEKPYKATLKNGVWTVTGTLPPGYDGGTAVAEIAQADGRILRVIHHQ